MKIHQIARVNRPEIDASILALGRELTLAPSRFAVLPVYGTNTSRRARVFAPSSSAYEELPPLKDSPEPPILEGSPEEDPNAGLVDVEPGIKAKEEVNIKNLNSHLRAKFQTIFAVYKKYGYADLEDNPMVITSGNDSWKDHARNSYHKHDRAIDVRGKHIPDKTLRKMATEIQKKLGGHFRVIAEITRYSKYWYKDHIHIEYRGK